MTTVSYTHVLRQTVEKLDRAVKDGLVSLNAEQKEDLSRLHELSASGSPNREEVAKLLNKFTHLLLGDK